MKNKKAEKLYNSITDVDDKFIKEAQELPEVNIRKIYPLKKWGAIAACLCFAVILLISMGRKAPTTDITQESEPGSSKEQANYSSDTSAQSEASSLEPQSNASTQNHNTQSKQIAVKLFMPSPKSPNSDAFGEDEYPHVDIVINSIMQYRQLELSEYKKYGLSKQLKKSDIGNLIGKVVEITGPSSKKFKVSSKDPALKNCSVYRYAPSDNDALLIVKNDKNCSFFIFDYFVDEGRHSLKEIYSVFGLKSEADINFLTYKISGMKGSDYQVVEEGKVTDNVKIKSFYDITSSLVPFAAPSSISATPDWLNDAYDEYRNHPDKYKREDITIEIHLKNGLIIPDIFYLPYIANGYVHNMEGLSAEENKILRDVFKED